MPAARTTLTGRLRAAFARRDRRRPDTDPQVERVQAALARADALGENWDGRGAPAPDPRALDVARRLLDAAHWSWHLDLTTFAVTAAADGAGVLIESIVDDVQLSLLIDPDGEHGYFVADDYGSGELAEGVATVDGAVRDFWTYGRVPWHAVAPGDLV
ncbi:hypothetical protein [Cellulosimicrobium sp. Marseille-Q4280]|uniref:hypothetical protein n=1 Tax=Cellulosimicrobium sp. Marseille-Q4280 TaxID=2937992 RepID=UPI00203B823E|nr:hypothetical protein [Cellulosimicrobium sp. Marseille-Q4280]